MKKVLVEKNIKKRAKQVPVGRILLPAFILDHPEANSNNAYEEQTLREAVEGAAKWATTKFTELDPDKIADGIGRVLNSYASIISKVSDAVTKVGTEFKLEEIEIGIAINKEGSVGIATLGVESSLKFVWKR